MDNEIDCSKCGSTWTFDFRSAKYELKRGRKNVGCAQCTGKPNVRRDACVIIRK